MQLVTNNFINIIDGFTSSLWSGSLFILSFLFFIGIILGVYFFVSFIISSLKNPSKKEKVSFLKLPLQSYENDIKFLDTLIEEKINFEKKCYIDIKKQMRTPMTHDIRDEIEERVLASVTNSLSKNYKNTMEKYFTVEGFNTYIVESIVTKIDEILLNNIIPKVNMSVNKV